MRRHLLTGLIALAMIAGYPYASLLILRVVGTSTVTMVEHDGTARVLISGPAAPRPDWVPQLPGAATLTAAHWLPAPDRKIAGDQQVISHASPETIQHFYMERLKAEGFDVRDIGYGVLNAPTAALLGIDGQLLGYRAADGVTISVNVRSPSGLVLRPRVVQLHWQTWNGTNAELHERFFGERRP